MRLLPRFRSWFRHRFGKRDYEAAQFNRLTSDLGASNLSPDAATWNSLATMRNRARTLERDNPIARKYLSIVTKRIVGCGIGLQNRAKLPNGKLDKAANSIVEAGWHKWGKRKYCCVDGQLSFARLARLAVRTVARDGESLLRIVRGFPNSFGFALQPFEPDLLDESYNDRLASGHEVRMGTELDIWKRPVAFHILTAHPGDAIAMYGRTSTRLKRERIEAKDIIYLGLPERAGQTRCTTWLSAAMLPIHHLNKYESAEVVAARQQACQTTFFEKQIPENLTDARTKSGDAVALPDGIDNGELIQETSPGQAVELPMGVKAVQPTPTHPNANFSEAKRSFLRSSASGLDVNFAELASDYKEGGNYSSLRAAALDQNPAWKILQQWVIEDLYERVFEEWLEVALLSGQLPGLFLADFDRLNQPDFRAEAFPFVDPVKDAQAQILLRDNKLKSHGQIIAEMGGDEEDTFDAISADEALAKEKGIVIPSSTATPAPQPSSEKDNPEDDDDDEPEDEDEDRHVTVVVAPPQHTGKRHVRFQRDAAGRMTTAEVSETDGAKIRFDQNGKLKGAEVVAKDGRVLKRVKFDHDAEGRLTGAHVTDETTPV